MSRQKLTKNSVRGRQQSFKGSKSRIRAQRRLVVGIGGVRISECLPSVFRPPFFDRLECRSRDRPHSGGRDQMRRQFCDRQSFFQSPEQIAHVWSKRRKKFNSFGVGGGLFDNPLGHVSPQQGQSFCCVALEFGRRGVLLNKRHQKRRRFFGECFSVSGVQFQSVKNARRVARWNSRRHRGSRQGKVAHLDSQINWTIIMSKDGRQFLALDHSMRHGGGVNEKVQRNRQSQFHKPQHCAGYHIVSQFGVSANRA